MWRRRHVLPTVTQIVTTLPPQETWLVATVSRKRPYDAKVLASPIQMTSGFHFGMASAPTHPE